MQHQLLITFSPQSGDCSPPSAELAHLEPHFFFFFFSKLHPLDSKTGANQCVHSTLQCIHVHLPLPPFRAALVPSWAMAPRSAPEAFSRRILTSLLRFSWVSSDVVSVPPPPPLLSSAEKKAPSLGSEVQVDFLFYDRRLFARRRRRARMGGRRRTGDAARALQTIVIPWLDFGVVQSLCLRVCLKW